MTTTLKQNEIIEMVMKCGFTLPEGESWYEAFPQCIETFAKLVADKATALAREESSKEYPVKFCSVKAFEDWCNDIRRNEREACAKVCEELQAPPHVSMSDVSMWDVTSMECADAIRARSNQECCGNPFKCKGNCVEHCADKVQP